MDMRMPRITCAAVFALWLSPAAAAELPSYVAAADALHAVVVAHETDNYYHYAGVHVVQDAALAGWPLLPLNDDNQAAAFAICLVNRVPATYAAVRERFTALLEHHGFSITGWHTDVAAYGRDAARGVRGWRAHTAIEALPTLYQRVDAWGGPGGYFPRCSIVVMTEVGISFVIHAIDTF